MTPAAHLVLTNGASGGDFLVDALNQHPQLCNYGEVLGPYTMSAGLHDRLRYGGSDPANYLDHVLSSHVHFALAQSYSAVVRPTRMQLPRPKRWRRLTSVGVTELAIRFAERGLDADYFLERPELKVISLHRDDNLQRAVALMLMGTTGVVRLKAAPRSGGQKLRFDRDELMEWLDTVEQEKRDQLAVVAQLPAEQHYAVVYEKLFASPADTREQVAAGYRFLGVEPIEVNLSRSPADDPDLPEMVANWDEIAEALAARDADDSS